MSIPSILRVTPTGVGKKYGPFQGWERRWDGVDDIIHARLHWVVEMLNNRGITAIFAFIAVWAVLFWGVGIGRVLFGSSLWGLAIGAVVGVVLAIIGVQFADAIVLKATRAKPLARGKYTKVRAWADEAAKQLRMPLPELYFTSEHLPDFFVFGSSQEKCCFVFTSGFLENTRPELIKAALAWGQVSLMRGSLQLRTLGSALAYIFMFPAKLGDFMSRGTEQRYNLLNLILLLPFAPLAAIFVHLTVGSKEEIYETDEHTADLTGDQGYIGVTLIEINKTIANFTVDTDLSLVPLFLAPPQCPNFYYNLFRPFPPVSKRINRLVKKREMLKKEAERNMAMKTRSLGG